MFRDGVGTDRVGEAPLGGSIPDEGLLFGRYVVVTLRGEHLYSLAGATMSDDLIDEEGFDCFFTEAEMLRQHCQLLEAELAELHSELRASRAKIATLVLMWSGVSRELGNAEAESRQHKEALEVAVHENRVLASVAVDGQKDDPPLPVAFSLTYAKLD